jgi:NTP pyrophosphatase (non-canonical NTP hydrolase)
MAKEKGWWPQLGFEGPDAPVRNLAAVEEVIPEKLMLVVSELAEALEEHRNGEELEYEGKHGKPEGLAVELADAVIRIEDLCGALGIDLDAVIERKIAYNATRSYRRGGKRC